MYQVRTAIARLIAFLALFAVAGCGGATLGAGGAKVSNDGDTVKVETDEGSLESSASLPDDFPRAEIPLLDGDLMNVTSLDTEIERGFTVTMRVAGDSLLEIADRGSALLEDLGYVSLGAMDSGEAIIRSYENDAWAIGLTVTVSDQDPVVSYSIAARSS